MRRGLDFLETLDFIDRERIGYAGGSMGGIIGAIFIGVEPRVKAAVLAVGGGNMSLMVRESEHPGRPADTRAGQGAGDELGRVPEAFRAQSSR
jgi:dipeptidyl aminopeptidase/acylaminoacyl peptidase